MKFPVILLLCTTVLGAAALPVTVDPATPLTGTYAVEWNTNGNFESWTTSQVTSATVASGYLTGTTSGTSPQIILSNFPGPDLDLGFNDYLEIRIRVPATHTGDIKISYGTTAKTGFSTDRVLVIPDALVPTDGAFHTYRIDVGPEPWWRANLRDLRIEPSATSGQAFAIDYLRVGDLPGDVVYQPRFTTECPAAGGATPGGAAFGAGQTVYSMESKHFRFLWNDAVAATSWWTTNMPHGTLRNLEEAWQLYVKVLGYLDPSLPIWGATSSTRCKLNVTAWYSGYWAGGDTDSSGITYGRLNITTDGLQVDPPTWIIPHELMHCFQFYNNGIANSDKTGYMPSEWGEFHANYGRERWLEYYQAFYPNSSGIDPSYLRCAHEIIGEGRDYYLCWPILLYLDQNPDGLADLGEGTVKKLWQQTGSGEYPLMTLKRLLTTTAWKDIFGGFARREATFNYAGKTAINATLAGFTSPLDNAATQRWQFADLVQRGDDTNWWRVPWEMAPMQGAYAIHELVPAGSGNGRVVTVNFHGLPDSARGADWSASFIVISDTGAERYSSLWSSGSNSVTLAANENKVYLSVAAAPATFYSMAWDEPTCPFRSAPAKARFPYEIQVTGATPKQRDNGSTSGLIQHSNGGGYKSSSASVASTAYVGPNARVLGSAIVGGNARIEDYAVVQGTANVSGNAVISGHAWVRANAVVNGNAKVRDWALVEGGTVTGNARVLEHANIKGGTVQDTATAKGTAASPSGTLAGNAIIDGDYGDFFTGRDVSNSIAFGFLPYNGIPDSYLRPLPAGLYAAYDFATAHDSRVLDQYGVTDGFTVGSPTWTSTDWKRKGFLTFDGSSQYVALDRSVADMRAFTFAAWVKPSGGAANQAVLWLGASTTKRLCLTPDDGTGHAKFSIVNGGTEQTLSASAALPTGVWSHIAVALDGTNGTLFVNGSAVATGAITITPDQLLAPNTTTGHQQNYLAKSDSDVMPKFQGSLDDVQFFSSALNATQLAALTVPLAGDVLLADNFDSASYLASAFNSTLSADQQGQLAPVSYTITGYDADYKIQHGNGGQMLMAGWYGGTGLDLHASPNHNFAVEANGLNKPIKVQFDMKITDSSNTSNWATVAIGSAQNVFVNNSANKFSSLFRHSGGTQQFASGTDVSVGGLSWTATGSTIAVILSDTAGNGSPFNGNGSVARMYVNGTLAGIYTLAQMAASDGYISFEGNGVFANYDNLSVSVVSTPTYPLTYNGNTNTGGGVPFDTASPYANGATVTVLGNTGGLVKTGYSFSKWNTAANGSGTSYKPGDTFPITSAVTLYAQWSPGPDFIWDNGAATGLWNTADANWLGVAWVNSASNNAWFNTVGGAISLGSGLTAGGVNVGSASANLPATSFSGGSLAAASLTMQGFGSNNGAYADNPTLSLNSAIAVSGDVSVGRSNLVVNGGTLTANRIITNAASADWGRVAIQGGIVTATNGVDGSVNTGATFQLELNGGTLETPSLRVANRDLNSAGPDGNNDANLLWNGGTLKAIGADNPNFITLYGDGGNGANPSQTAYVQAGGAIIDTNGRNIGIQVRLLGAGGLTKTGAGTLTLTASNSYTGNTTVTAGTLSLGNGTQNTNLADKAGVILAAGAILDLHYTGTDTVNTLSVGGIAKPPGVYSASNSTFLTGSGTLTVLTGPPSDYNTWASANHLTSGSLGDDDHDGLTNFAEYAFGLDPKNGGSSAPIAVPLDRSTGTFRFTRRKPSLTGLTYTVWYSIDLASWTQDTGASQTLVTTSGEVETVQVTLSGKMTANPKLFVRISAQ